MESMKDFERELELSFRKIEEGEIITGTVISITEEEVTVDLRYYAQGIIPAENLSNDPDYQVFEQLHEGDEISATVIKRDDGNGNILLSMKEANDVLAWDILEKMRDEEEIVSVKIGRSVSGGVVTYLQGIRAFIPASQLTQEYVEDTESFVGKVLEVKVITVDREKEKLVLSSRAVERERAEEQRNHMISMLVPGTVMEGKVESLKPYGAFVNLGNSLIGLIHISQISQKRIKKPSEVLKIGQTVKVKLLNTNDNKINLSMRAIEEEMTEVEEDIMKDLDQYTEKESIGSSLGDLLAKLNL